MLTYTSPLKHQETQYVQKKSDRIIVAEFNGNPLTAFIACYCQTKKIDKKLVEDFYSDLKRETEIAPPTTSSLSQAISLVK